MASSTGGVSRQSPLHHNKSSKTIATGEVINALEVVRLVVKKEKEKEDRRKKRQATWQDFMLDAEETLINPDD